MPFAGAPGAQRSGEGRGPSSGGMCRHHGWGVAYRDGGQGAQPHRQDRRLPGQPGGHQDAHQVGRASKS